MLKRIAVGLALASTLAMSTGCGVYAFSPDGTQLLFTRLGSTGDSRTMLWNGKSLRRTDINSAEDAAWSPDGNYVLLTQDSDSRDDGSQFGGLKLVNVSTGKSVDIAEHAGQAVWREDSAHFAAIYSPKDTGSELREYDLTGAVETSVPIPQPLVATGPVAWLPGTDDLALEANQGIYLLESGELHRISSDAGTMISIEHGNLVWATATAKSWTIATFDLKARTVTRTTRPLPAGIQKPPRGTSSRQVFPLLCPDGERVAFIVMDQGASKWKQGFQPGVEAVYAAGRVGSTSRRLFLGATNGELRKSGVDLVFRRFDKVDDFHVAYPFWSPNGKRLGLVEFTQHGKSHMTNAIYTFNPDGTGRSAVPMHNPGSKSKAFKAQKGRDLWAAAVPAHAQDAVGR